MIKKIIMSVIFNFFCLIIFCQETKKVTGFFDNDDIEDIIDYKFVANQMDGPYYMCKIICGNGKKYNFSIGVGFESMQISQCNKKGCIETYQWKTGMQGFEINENYIYSKEFDNWILQKRENIYSKQVLVKGKTIYKNGKKEIHQPQVPTGIDGKEYKMLDKKSNKKNTISKTNSQDKDTITGLYVLKNCENTRFKIQILKKKSDYFYSIIDKNIIILKGVFYINKTQIKLGEITGVMTKSKIVIQNYFDSNIKNSNFTQCADKSLDFIKS